MQWYLDWFYSMRPGELLWYFALAAFFGAVLLFIAAKVRRRFWGA
jgi:hypothetical protein